MIMHQMSLLYFMAKPLKLLLPHDQSLKIQLALQNKTDSDNTTNVENVMRPYVTFDIQYFLMQPESQPRSVCGLKCCAEWWCHVLLQRMTWNCWVSRLTGGLKCERHAQGGVLTHHTHCKNIWYLESAQLRFLPQVNNSFFRTSLINICDVSKAIFQITPNQMFSFTFSTLIIMQKRMCLLSNSPSNFLTVTYTMPYCKCSFSNLHPTNSRTLSHNLNLQDLKCSSSNKNTKNTLNTLKLQTKLLKTCQMLKSSSLWLQS